MTCNIAGCNEVTEEMFCDRHRCKGLTAKGKRCKSSMNCGIVHTSYMEDAVPEGPKMLPLRCWKCNKQFSAEVGTPEARALAEAWVKARGICKECRS